MKKSVRILLILLFIVFIGIFCFSAFKLYSIMHEYKVSEEKYDHLSGQYVSAPTETAVAAAPNADASEPSDPVVERSPVAVNFSRLREESSDVVGWIYGPDTMINYPVVRAEDNEYYLHRFIDGSYNGGGSIFMDYTCAGDFSSDNTVLYGHHMQDGSMFASLSDYRKEGYYEAHPILYLNTPEQNYKIEVIAGYITDAESEVYMVTFPTTEYHTWYLGWIRSMSNFTSNVEVGLEDRLITLSTCSYEYEDARYVVQGKLVPIA